MTEQSGMLRNIRLGFWNMPAAKEVEFRPTIQQTRNRLGDAGLPEKYAEDIGETTAFRRACDQCRAPDIEARCFKGADDELYCQIDQLVPESDTESAKLRRTNKGVWKHTIAGPVRVRGYDRVTDDMMVTEYESAKTTYQYADIGRMLMQILTKEGLGIFSPRKSGGIYFIPTDESCSKLMERVAAFCVAMSVDLLQYDIPDTEAQRQAIGEAIAAGIAVEVAQHREAVEAYTATTRPETFSNRRALMGQTAMLLVRLSIYLNGHAASIAGELDVLENRIQALQDEAANAVQGMGRRVLTAK